MKNVPKRIFLNLGEMSEREFRETDFNELSEVTWCSDEVQGKNIEYIRKDSLFDNARMQKDRWREAVDASNRAVESHKDEKYTLTNAFVDGVQWADEHPSQELLDAFTKKALTWLLDNIEGYVDDSELSEFRFEKDFIEAMKQ